MRRHTHAPRHGACHAQRATRTMGVWNPDKKHDGPAPEVDTPRQRQAAGAGPRWSRQCAVARISGFPAVGINLAGNWSYACAAMPCQLHTSAWNESTPDWGAAATQQEHIRPTATPSCGGTPAGAGEGISDNAVTAPPPPPDVGQRRLTGCVCGRRDDATRAMHHRSVVAGRCAAQPQGTLR